MKKLVAIALVLVMALTLTCTAFAETRTFVLTYVTDLEGIDMEVEELPTLSVTIDDEAMTCVYTTAEGEEEGTLEVVEQHAAEVEGDEPYVVIQVTLTNSGEVIVMYVFQDQIEIEDEENGVCYILVNAELLNEEAA